MREMQNSDDEFLKLLGNRIRDSRKSLGMTQEQLAELTKVSLVYVSSIENGKANASIRVYRRLANVLLVPLSQLVDVNQGKVKRDVLSKAFFEIKSLGRKEQKIFIETIKGLMAGMKE